MSASVMLKIPVQTGKRPAPARLVERLSAPRATAAGLDSDQAAARRELLQAYARAARVQSANVNSARSERALHARALRKQAQEERLASTLQAAEQRRAGSLEAVVKKAQADLAKVRAVQAQAEQALAAKRQEQAHKMEAASEKRERALRRTVFKAQDAAQRAKSVKAQRVAKAASVADRLHLAVEAAQERRAEELARRTAHAAADLARVEKRRPRNSPATEAEVEAAEVVEAASPLEARLERAGAQREAVLGGIKERAAKVGAKAAEKVAAHRARLTHKLKAQQERLEARLLDAARRRATLSPTSRNLFGHINGGLSC